MKSSGTSLHFIKVWLTIGAMLIVAAFIGSLGPYPIRSHIHNLDKIFHAATYAGLAYWFMQLSEFRKHLWVALGFILMGVLIEVLQSFTRTRTPDVYDALANTVGVAAGWLIVQTPAGRLISIVDSWISAGKRTPLN